MSMTNLAVTKGGALSVTGGTALSFSPNNAPVQNGVNLINAAQTDFRLRENILGKYRAPVQNGPASFTKAKITFFVKVPRLKADGTYSSNIGRLEFEIDPETPVSEQDDLFLITAQLAVDSDTLNFRRTGSIL